jgi:hypothetical protein
LKSRKIEILFTSMRTQQQDSDATTTIMPSIAKANATSPTAAAKGRAALFQKSTRKNQEFERFLCNGQEAAVLDATTSKYIPLTYFVTPQTTTASPHPHTASPTPHNTSSEASAVGGRNPQRTPRHAHGLADKMPFESFKLINLQQRGNHAHSLVLFKSRAITTNPEQIAIFECNGQVSQSEIRVIHTYHPDADADDEPGTVYDVTEHYFTPVSPRICMNYGSDRHNPGYCGIFGMIAMTFFRQWGSEPTKWVKKWTQLLKYMRQDLQDEPKCHGCMGTDLAAKVQEIIAAHPSTATGHQNAEKEILRTLKDALRSLKE